MDFTVEAGELSAALSAVSGVAAKKNTMPVLGCVLVTAKDSSVTLVATDLDVTVEIRREAEVSAPGASCISVQSLAAVARELAGGDVRLKQAAGAHVELKCGKTKAKLLALKADEFPTLPKAADDERKVDFDELSAVIDATLYSASQDATRFNLCGVYLCDGAAVATDGHRLATVSTSLHAKLGLESPIIMPRRGLELVRRVLGGEDGDVFAGISSNMLSLARGATRLTMRLVDGVFPDYKQVIPRGQTKVVTLSASAILSTLRRVVALSSDKMRQVKIALSRDTLVVSCTDPEAGEIVDEAEVAYDKGDIEVAFNGRYLMDAIEHLGADDLTLSLDTPLTPGKISPVRDDSIVAVVMPMRS